MSLIFKVKAKIKGILSKYTSLSITGTTSNIKIDKKYVDDHLVELSKNEDLSRYIL